MGPRGQGHLYKPNYVLSSGERRPLAIWWWKAPTGRRYSTGLRDRSEAERWVLERLQELRDGLPVTVAAGPLRYDDLEQMLLNDWTIKERRGALQARARMKHLNRGFSGWHVAAITTDKVTGYAVHRRQQGAAPATINAEIAILHRGFVLARRAAKLRDVPIMDRLPGVGHRTGTIERGDLDAILRAMPAIYCPVIKALYWTGWRLSEILGLTWQRVDLAAGEMRLETSKTGQPRILSFSSIPELRELLELQHARRGFTPYVFSCRAGRPIARTTVERHWRAACRAVGVPDARIIHDLRRTAVRDLRRAGVSLAVAMGAVGHQSLSIHQGYSVVAREDQDAGMAQLVALRAGEPVQRRLVDFGLTARP